jgi:hypothetical protein
MKSILRLLSGLMLGIVVNLQAYALLAGVTPDSPAAE